MFVSTYFLSFLTSILILFNRHFILIFALLSFGISDYNNFIFYQTSSLSLRNVYLIHCLEQHLTFLFNEKFICWFWCDVRLYFSTQCFRNNIFINPATLSNISYIYDYTNTLVWSAFLLLYHSFMCQMRTFGSPQLLFFHFFYHSYLSWSPFIKSHYVAYSLFNRFFLPSAYAC